ncbi:uncharacterized protein LOC142143202 [Mixophyes fleayi]|uniref:uncharacterized protein LOC142143202 n=1 Tax=Mixophyes fleayi TaxID=3061075 RepID=UPI003F4E0A15
MEVEGSEEGEGEVEETGQSRKTKTGRNVRFSHDENCVLVHNIIPCYEVILGNLAARTPLRRRHQLWGRVCDAVNAVGPLKRTVAHCRKRFSDIKRRLKEKMAQERRSTRRTGGGPPLRVEYTSYEEELRQIMPREIVEGINVQDTDSPSFAQGVDSPGPQLSPIPTATPPPSVRDSATEEQAGPSSYQAPQVESLQMSPEPDEQTIITLETVDAPVSGFQDVAPGPAEAPAHQQPAPQSMDPAREMAQSIDREYFTYSENTPMRVNAIELSDRPVEKPQTLVKKVPECRSECDKNSLAYKNVNSSSPYSQYDETGGHKGTGTSYWESTSKLACTTKKNRSSNMKDDQDMTMANKGRDRGTQDKSRY